MYTQSMRTTDRTRGDPGKTWDWLAAVLVFLMIQVAAARLVMTAWTPFLYFIQTLGAFSAALGLALGRSRFGRGTARGLALAYTAVLLPWQLTQAVDAQATFADKLASIGGRLWFSLGQFFARRPVDDAFLFVAFVSLAFWVLGLSAGFSLTRQRDYLAAVLPAGIVLLIIQAYDNFVPARIWALGLYVFLALCLLGRMYFNQTRTLWDRERVLVTFESRRDLMNSMIASAAIAVLVAWSLPTSLAEVQAASQSWNRFTRPFRDRFSNAVSALESPYGQGSGQGDFYTGNLSLGQNASLGDAPVLTISADHGDEELPPRYYWRGHVYNHYANGRWSSTSTINTDFSPETDELAIPDFEFERNEAVFTVTTRLSQQGLLYAPAEPFWVNRPGSVLSAPITDQGRDLAAWTAEPGLFAGDRYEVRVRIANPTVEDLRAAGTEYPDWVTARYLEVPEAIVPDLSALAEEITAGQDTPYDKAQAITVFLRQEIEYSTTLAAPPQGRDPILWVLLDYKRGFCLYYASAEVLMLRSLGIPARMAAGFAEGQAAEGRVEENIQETIYTVRRVDAHAWPEVFFPGIGWVEFEPTGNQDPLNRPLNSSPSSVNSNPAPILPGLEPEENADGLGEEAAMDESAQAAPVPFNETPLARGLWISFWILLAAVLVLFNARYDWAQKIPVLITESYARSGAQPPAWVDRWARWNNISPIERSFQAVNLSLRWLGRPQPMHVTPVERALTLKKLLPAASGPVEVLLAEHQSALYSPRPGNPARARQASLEILLKTLQARLHKLVEFITGTPIEPDGNP
jgi:transglutaminase-like putative cysteine protease